MTAPVAVITRQQPQQLPAVLFFSAFISLLLLACYNLLLHPLRRVPGPLLARCSPIWAMRTIYKKQWNKRIYMLHETYGPVVRIAPNELSFATVEAHNDIHTPRGPQSLLKADTIEHIMGDIVWPAKNLLTTHDPVEHKRLRNALAPAFTAAALVEQEEIQQVHIDRMLQRICHRIQMEDLPMDLLEYLSRCVWDIVGELSFGEALPGSQKDAFETLKVTFCRLASLLELVQYIIGMPVLGFVTKAVIRLAGNAFRVLNTIITRRKIGEFLEGQHNRKNFLTAIVAAQTKCLLSHTELLSNSSLLVMVGFDTTATTLAAIFHLLLRHPLALARLQRELYAAYTSPAEITAQSTKSLPFLNGCIQEALRLFPPANGITVSADMYAIQRRPQYWCLADEFRPERWLRPDDGGHQQQEGREEELSAFEHDNRAAHRPFLVGPRVCIGRFVAMQALRLMVAHTVFRFNLERPAGDDFDWGRDTESSYLWLGYEVRAKVSVKRG